MQTRFIVVMGVSGSGKSTVAERVASMLDWPFVEGDALHPDANVEKMRQGTPLDDADRAPWLAAVAGTLRQWRDEGRAGVVSCSALRRAYRERIADGHEDVLFVYLRGSRKLIAERLAGREDHFMPSGLLESQFATLEPPQIPPENALCLDIDRAPQAIAQDVVRSVSSG